MNDMKAAAACLAAAGAAVCAIAVFRTYEALTDDLPFKDWFWTDVSYGAPISGLYFVGGLLLGIGLALMRRW